MIPALCLAFIVLRVGAVLGHSAIEPPWPRGNLKRAGILHEMKQREGQHLLIVRYSPNHDVDDEYVYNPADIDSSKVIFARDMGPDQNKELLEYYTNRRVWMLEPDVPDAEPAPLR